MRSDYSGAKANIFFQSSGDDGPKNKPKAGRGVTFSWADNPHVTSRPFKLGVPNDDLLKLKLKDTTGKSFDFHYAQRKNADWNSKNFVRLANGWMAQLISRRFKNQEAPDGKRRRKTRPAWSLMERQYLEALIERRIRENRSDLSRRDWLEITTNFNSRFLGTMLRVGHPLATMSKEKKGGARKRNLVKVDRIIENRTVDGIRTQIKHWPETLSMITRVLGEVDAEAADSSATDIDDSKGYLEEDSDPDEEEGTEGYNWYGSSGGRGDRKDTGLKKRRDFDDDEDPENYTKNHPGGGGGMSYGRAVVA